MSPDELARAVKPLVAARQKAFETNHYWLTNLPLVLRDPRARTPVLDYADGIASVTADQVQAVFARFVADKVPVTVIAKAK